MVESLQQERDGRVRDTPLSAHARESSWPASRQTKRPICNISFRKKLRGRRARTALGMFFSPEGGEAPEGTSSVRRSRVPQEGPRAEPGL